MMMVNPRINTVMVYPVSDILQRRLKHQMRDFVGGIRSFDTRDGYVVIEFNRFREFARAMNLGTIKLEETLVKIERFRGEEDAPPPPLNFVQRDGVAERRNNFEVPQLVLAFTSTVTTDPLPIAEESAYLSPAEEEPEPLNLPGDTTHVADNPPSPYAYRVSISPPNAPTSPPYDPASAEVEIFARASPSPRPRAASLDPEQ